MFKHWQVAKLEVTFYSIIEVCSMEVLHLIYKLFYLTKSNQSVTISERIIPITMDNIQKLQRYVFVSENSETISEIQKKKILLCCVEDIKEIQYSYITTWGEKVWFCPSSVVFKCLF